MKKILNEWKKWLTETAPKDKYYGLRKRAGANPHDRAIPDTLRQEDFRSTFKAVLKNFMYSHLAFGQVEDFISNMSDDEKGKIAKDLNVLKYIYMGRTDYDIMDTDNIGTGIIFDNLPKVSGSPVEKIDAVMEDLDFHIEQSVPSDADVQEAYIFYVKPNYQAALEPPQPKNPSKFASQMAFSADRLAQMNKDLWIKNKKREK